jgi:hypothetical protein
MRMAEATVLNATDTTNQTSQLIDGNQIIGASFQASFGTDTLAAGTLQLQASNDPNSNDNLVTSNITVTNWTNVPGSTATAVVASGASAYVYLPVNFIARWYRLTWTHTGGAGTINVNMFYQSI